MSREIELLTEIRDLLHLIAEPALAQRDAKLRSALKAVVGASTKKAKAVLLMDGTRSQSVIAKEAAIDQGELSRLVKGLGAAQLLVTSERHPKILVKVPPTYFQSNEADER